MDSIEKLGAFYIGRMYDAEAGATTNEDLLYDAKDLTTHAVCVGMTGSGKTGLCVSLLEEAAIDGIPAIAIDPKGDLGNLLLNFPTLKPSDFAPWIDPGEATRKGQTLEQTAEETAARWREGLADWGQDGKRIRRLRDSADFSIYTPGSNAGLPLKVLKSFSAPSEALRQDPDAMRDRIQASVSGLLGMLGITADPIQSREHILLSNLLNHHWNQGKDLDLPGVIRGIQQPPFQSLGVFDLESFYPAKERFTLAMTLNNLLSSPSFSSWLEGEPLDIQRLLWTSDGKPRISVISIAHLRESERMFFVTLLLNEVVAWMRSQPGTASLRALLYMDEIFGYFPPRQNPPSKRPMLTLLKQARAYGLGCVLATQNPVDLDYKGLSNTGTWFIGRLQTERDKLRVLDGLEGASATTGTPFDRKKTETILSGLGKRVFLMNNVHDNGPALFQTRWALSYLRGPLTRTQISALMSPRKELSAKDSTSQASAAPAPTASTPAVRLPERASTDPASSTPRLPPSVKQFYLECTSEPAPGSKFVYRPTIGARCRLHFVNARAKTDEWKSTYLLIDIPEADGLIRPDGVSSGEDLEWVRKGRSEAGHAALPSHAAVASAYKTWGKELKSHLYKEESVTVLKCAALKKRSLPDEAEGDFRPRLQHESRERRDLELEKLKRKFMPKFERLRERIRKAEDKAEIQAAQYKQQKMSTVISLGTTLLGAFLGRKASIGTASRAGSTLKSAARSGKEKEDIVRAKAETEARNEELKNLEAQFEEAMQDVKDKYQVDNLELEEIVIRPRKSDIAVTQLCLLWTPWQIGPDGIAGKLF